MKVLCGLFLKETSPGQLSCLAECCLRLSPQIALSHQAVFIEIDKCKKIHGEHGMKLRLMALSKRLGLAPLIGIGGNISEALACARFQKKERLKLSIEALKDYASPLMRDEELEKEIAHLILTMQRLGILDLEGFIRLPRKAVLTRFGKTGLCLHERISEAPRLPWPVFKPKERLLEQTLIDSDYSVQDLEPLLFILRGLADRALTRLFGQGRRATKISLKLNTEPYSTVKEPCRHWNLELSAPQGHVLSLISILRERLSKDLQLKPLESPVNEAVFEILESTPSTSAQKDFFNKKEEELEAWNSLVARLCERLGPNKVFFASPAQNYVPEKGWTMQTNFSEETVAQVSQSEEFPFPFPERPLRLLREPQELYRSGEALFHEDRMWRIRKWEGPEILNAEWWRDKIDRHYFRVDTHNGEDLWIFTVPGSTKVYLHGYFD